jgi:hypothetical protein
MVRGLLLGFSTPPRRRLGRAGQCRREVEGVGEPEEGGRGRVEEMRVQMPETFTRRTGQRPRGSRRKVYLAQSHSREGDDQVVAREEVVVEVEVEVEEEVWKEVVVVGDQGSVIETKDEIIPHPHHLGRTTPRFLHR